MADIGIIGSYDIVEIFKLLGVEVYHAENADQAKKQLAKIIEEEKLKIVFVLERLALHMKEEMIKIEELDWLTVVPLPDHKSEVSYLDDQIRRLSREAIGMEI